LRDRRERAHGVRSRERRQLVGRKDAPRGGVARTGTARIVQRAQILPEPLALRRRLLHGS
jgi:hypothetical protein